MSGGGGSKDGAKALQVAVARLRKALESGTEEGLLLTRPPGYELRLAPGQLNLQRFERLVAEARAADPATAAAKLRDALALWRGPPLADLAYESFCQAEIAWLDELRLAALEDRPRADLELGGHVESVGELERLVADHPLRERLRELLMLALYRSGRHLPPRRRNRHFEEAIAMNERIGARPWLAHARRDLGALLLAHGLPEHAERARLLLSQALATYRELGMPARGL